MVSLPLSQRGVAKRLSVTLLLFRVVGLAGLRLCKGRLVTREGAADMAGYGEVLFFEVSIVGGMPGVKGSLGGDPLVWCESRS
ncbi:hypothetical protein Pyrfu_0467 [Pyrolobus fumarii 1A]|uniref:Uncharacterized protein n=1 Tax=Pyrolobus fumarii (strain DSM 11204 / 1A) TaxID=694429 RepID=G0EG90_PYRF1|nr:hypothetical protein Pyrfu_0467 [Pyrolobus fumarii 1A]